jgi:hypothetical protein
MLFNHFNEGIQTIHAFSLPQTVTYLGQQWIAMILSDATEARTNLVVQEVAAIGDKDSLEQIANVVEGLDSLLYKTIKGQVTEVRLGDEYSADWNKGAIGTHHHYSDIVVTGKALLGNKYGGKDFWDD